MAECNANELIDSAKCFVSLPEHLQNAAKMALWCQISEAVVPPADGTFVQIDEDDFVLIDGDGNVELGP